MVRRRLNSNGERTSRPLDPDVRTSRPHSAYPTTSWAADRSSRSPRRGSPPPRDQATGWRNRRNALAVPLPNVVRRRLNSNGERTSRPLDPDVRTRRPHSAYPTTSWAADRSSRSPRLGSPPPRDQATGWRKRRDALAVPSPNVVRRRLSSNGERTSRPLDPDVRTRRPHSAYPTTSWAADRSSRSPRRGSPPPRDQATGWRKRRNALAVPSPNVVRRRLNSNGERTSRPFDPDVRTRRPHSAYPTTSWAADRSSRSPRLGSPPPRDQATG